MVALTQYVYARGLIQKFQDWFIFAKYTEHIDSIKLVPFEVTS